MELTTYKTGFFPTWNAFNPMVILKLKNISSRNLTWDDDRIKVTATFISEGEELGSDYCYIPSSSDAPWNPGISRQIYFKSNWTAMYDTAMKSKITCKIYIDNRLCKSFETRIFESVAAQRPHIRRHKRAYAYHNRRVPPDNICVPQGQLLRDGARDKGNTRHLPLRYGHLLNQYRP